MGGCRECGCRAGSTRVNLAKGERQAKPLGHTTAQTACCITCTQGQRPGWWLGLAAPTWQSQELTSLSHTKRPLCCVPECTGAAPEMKGHCCL